MVSTATFSACSLGVAIRPGGDQRERHGLAPVGPGQLQRGAVGRGQQLPLPVAATPPDGAHRVDDELRRQAVAAGDFGLSGLASFRVRHSASSSGPAARWMAPSTPPPPSRLSLAALTMASTFMVVISFRTICRGITAPPRVLVLSYHRRACLAIR